MFTNKIRAVAGIALAATAALAVAGTAQAGPLKPNAADPGDVQLMTIDGNSSLVHTIRHSNGSWQSFGRLGDYSGVVGLTSTLLNGEENAFFQYTSPKGTQLAHFVRHADGSWNLSAGTPALDAGGTVDGLSATVVSGKVELLQLKNGVVKVSTQGADGTWSPWAAVPSNGAVRSVAATATGDTLRVVELSADGHTVTDFDQYSSGNWSTGQSKSVNTDPNYTATEVAAAGDYSGVQIAVTESYLGYGGGVYHSKITDALGSWDPFLPIAPQINNYWSASHVSMEFASGEMQLTFSTPSGQLFHTIRFYDGSWQTAGDVEGAAGNITAGPVTIAGYTY